MNTLLTTPEERTRTPRRHESTTKPPAPLSSGRPCTLCYLNARTGSSQKVFQRQELTNALQKNKKQDWFFASRRRPGAQEVGEELVYRSAGY